MIIFTGSDARFQVTSHIPDQGTQLVHYYGAYSNAHRGIALRREVFIEIPPEDEPSDPPRPDPFPDYEWIPIPWWVY